MSKKHRREREHAYHRQERLDGLAEAISSQMLPADSKKLPAGWRSIALYKAPVKILSGFSCARRYSVPEGLLHLRPFNIGSNGELDLSNRIFIPVNFVPNPEDYYLQPGDILFNNTNSPELVGKSAIVREPIACAFSNHLTRIRITDKEILDPHWLLVFLRYLWQTGYFAANCNRWIGQAGFAPSKLRQLRILCPPIDEQRRIVARLEALLGEVREMRAEIRAMREDLERLMEAVLAEVFPKKLSKEEVPEPGWTTRSFEEIIRTSPQYGYTASAQFEPVGPKFLRITDIRKGDVNWDSVPYCQIEESRLDKYSLKDGDILIARSGSVGKACLVKEPPLSVFGSYLIRICIQPDIVPDYVFWFCQSPQYWRQVQDKLRRVTQPNINAQMIKSFLIAIPNPLAEQHRIVAYLDAVHEEIKAMRAILDEDERAVEELEQSILAAAFRGEV